MGIRLIKVSFSNFMSSTDEIVVKLTNRGLLLIEGENLDCPTADSNGAGKTMIFDAISFALYGKTARGIAGDEVVNREAGKGCRVELKLQKDGEKYTIIREQKGKEGNSLELVAESRETKVSKAKTQDEIIRLMGMSYDAFMNCVMFGQRIEKFFTAETDAKQKEILEEILSLPDFSPAVITAKAKIKEIESQLAAGNSSIEALNEKEKYLQGKIAEEKERQEGFQEVIKAKQVEIDDLQSELDGTDWEASIEKIVRKTASLEANLKQYRFDEAHMKARLESIRDVTTGLLTSIAKADTGVAHLSNDVREIIDKMASAKKMKGSCTECGAAITKESVKSHVAELQDKVTRLESTISSYKRDSSDMKKQLATKKAQVDTIMESIKSLTQKCLDTEKLIMAEEDKKRNLSAEFSRSSKRIEELKQNLAEFTSHFSDTSQLESMEMEIRRLAKGRRIQQAKTDSLGSEKSMLVFWAQAFGAQGIKSFVFDSVVPSLVDKANHYSRLLTGGRVYIDISTEKELKSGEKRNKFEISANNMDGSEVYKGNSSGERRRIDLCILLSLHDLLEERVGNSVSILFFDEVFDSLDSTGSDSVLELLEALAREKESVIVITHNPDLKPRFEHRLTIRKEGGVSQIVDN